MNKKRLLKLADFLDTLKPKNFDVSEWARQGTVWIRGDEVKPDCGTVACAAGWACFIPEFQRLGLMLAPNREGVFVVCFDHYWGDDAIEIFFGLGEDSSLTSRIFYQDGYDDSRVTPKMVAKRIRQVVANKS